MNNQYCTVPIIYPSPDPAPNPSPDPAPYPSPDPVPCPIKIEDCPTIPIKSLVDLL